jgi:hypothetical protein
MKQISVPIRMGMLLVFFCCGAVAETQRKTATVHLRIVTTPGDDLGVATVKTFEWEGGDVRPPNFADRFRKNTASDIPYGLYRLCARSTGFWTACTEVPVYQPEVWAVLPLRVEPDPFGLAQVTGMLRNVTSPGSPVWVRLMGVYWGMTVDAKADSSGRFQMSGIPPGQWVLVTIQDKRILDTRPIEVPASGAVEIDIQTRK